ncbi:unnamed protein product [Prunus armeniaca]
MISLWACLGCWLRAGGLNPSKGASYPGKRPCAGGALIVTTSVISHQSLLAVTHQSMVSGLIL